LRAGQAVSLTAEDPGLIVKPEAARRQLEIKTTEREAEKGDTVQGDTSREDGNGVKSGGEPEDRAPRLPRRYHGTVQLNPLRVGAEAGRIAEEVIAHLAGQPGAEVTVTLEIRVHLPGGASDHTVRTVMENSRALKFENYGFEKD